MADYEVMTDEDKDLLRINAVEFNKEIDLSPEKDFFGELTKRKVFTDGQIAAYTSKLRYDGGPIVANEAMRSALVKGSKKKFQDFKKALIANEQKHIVTKYLTPKIQDQESKLEGMDLSDGLIDVDVKKSTKDFFDKCNEKTDLEKPDIYPMGKNPKGYALIINVKKVVRCKERLGTDIDRDNLKNLLEQMSFTVKVYNDTDDLTAQGILEKTKSFFREAEESDAQCTMVFVLSHGATGGRIFGTDRNYVQRKQLYELCNANNARGLLNKPKIFVIQACRGSKSDSGIDAADNEDEPDEIEESDGTEKIASHSDTLFAFPTQEGYRSWRNETHGSWFIKAIVQIFQKFAATEDILSMLTMVNQLIMKKETRNKEEEKNKKMEMSEFKSSLSKKLFFFPGVNSRKRRNSSNS